MPGPASVVATVITGIADVVKAGVEWARKQKEKDQAEGQKLVDQMKADTAEIERRAHEAERKP